MLYSYDEEMSKKVELRIMLLQKKTHLNDDDPLDGCFSSKGKKIIT